MYDVEEIIDGSLMVTYVLVGEDSYREWVQEGIMMSSYRLLNNAKIKPLHPKPKKPTNRKPKKKVIKKVKIETQQPSWHNEKKKDKVKKPRKSRPQLNINIRIKVKERDGYKCVHCGSFINLEVHHIVHRKHGGTDELDNLKTLCCYCHLKEHKGEPVYNLMLSSLKKKGLI